MREQAPGLQQAAFLLLVMLLLAPWFFIQCRAMPNSDMLWLAEAFDRWVDGMRMKDAIYESNPPLSLFAYAVPQLLQRWTGWGIAPLLFVWIASLTLLATILFYRCLRLWPELGQQQAAVAALAFLLVNSINSSTSFGERDHLTSLFLAPFVLFQTHLTRGVVRSKAIARAVLWCAPPFILLKPHHVLLPALILLHRMIMQRRLAVIVAPDALSIGLWTIVIAAGTWLFFPDYVMTVMSDVVRYYLDVRDPATFPIAGRIALVIFGMMGLALMAGPATNPALLFLSAALVSLIPYIIQGRAYSYQLMPCFAFLAPGFGLIAHAICGRVEKRLQMIMSVFILYGLSVSLTPLNPAYPSLSKLRDFPLSQMVADCKSLPNCSFFMFHADMGIIHETSAATEVFHASRFPSFWFLPGLIQSGDDSDRRRFSGMVADDIARFAPRYIFILQGLRIQGLDGPFDFMSYFSADDHFRRQMAHYARQEDIMIDPASYFAGTNAAKAPPLRFAVYRRQKEKIAIRE